MSDVAAERVPDSGEESRSHVSVVFFHGIGQQRHYESIAELVDVVRKHVRGHINEINRRKGVPRLAMETRFLRESVDGAGPDDDVACIEVTCDAATVRFYDAYWAPSALGGPSARSVLWWLLSQIKRPVTVLTAPWRRLARLRLADLFDLEESAVGSHAVDGETVARLARFYQRYCDLLDSQRGTFRQFVTYLGREIHDAQTKQAVLQLARRWRRHHRLMELARLLVLLGTGISLVAAAALMLVGAYSALGWIAGFLRLLPPSIGSALASPLEPTWVNAVSILGLALWLVGARGFSVDFVGDVQQFCTYEECAPLHERREKILKSAEKAMRHVLSDPECSRVVVVGHSLGTAIAYDTILRLRRSVFSQPMGEPGVGPVLESPAQGEQQLPLDRIRHVITSGSPVDKIAYFFATQASKTPGFEMFIDRLRGDVRGEPFSEARDRPRLHWINFWDAGDIISGSLQTPRSPFAPELQVDNVRIATYQLPDPAASHGAYFRSSTYAGTIFDVAFRGRYTYRAGNAELVGPGAGKAAQTAWMWLFALVPLAMVWALLAGLGFGTRSAPLVTLGLLTVVFIVAVAIHKVAALRRANAADEG